MKSIFTLLLSLLLINTIAYTQVLEIIYPDTNYVKIKVNQKISFEDTLYFPREYLNMTHPIGNRMNFIFDHCEKNFQLTLKEEYEKVIVYRDSLKIDTLIVAYPENMSNYHSVRLGRPIDIDKIYEIEPYPIKKKLDSIHTLNDTFPLPTYSLNTFEFYKEFFDNGRIKLIESIKFIHTKNKKEGNYTIRQSNAWYEDGQKRWSKLGFENFCLSDTAWHQNGQIKFEFILNKSDTIVLNEFYPNGELKKQSFYYCHQRRSGANKCVFCGTDWDRPSLLKFESYDSNQKLIEFWPKNKVTTYLNKDRNTYFRVIDTMGWYRDFSHGFYEGNIGDTIVEVDEPNNKWVGDTLVVFYNNRMTDTAIVAIYQRTPYPNIDLLPFKKEEYKYDRLGNLISYLNFDKGIYKGWYSNGQKKWVLPPMLRNASNTLWGCTLNDTIWHSNGNVMVAYDKEQNGDVIKIQYHENGKINEKAYYTTKLFKSNYSRYYNFKDLYFKNERLEFYKSISYYDNGQYAGAIYNDLLGSDLRENLKAYYENGQLALIREYDGRDIYGEYKFYHQNGQLKILGQYSKNFPPPMTKEEKKNPSLYSKKMRASESYKVGSWKYWDEEGKLIKEEIYKDGLVEKVIDY